MGCIEDNQKVCSCFQDLRCREEDTWTINENGEISKTPRDKLTWRGQSLEWQKKRKLEKQEIAIGTLYERWSGRSFTEHQSEHGMGA